jgi:hypothetical protein
MKALPVLVLVPLLWACPGVRQSLADSLVPPAASQPVDTTDRYSDAQLSGRLTVADVRLYYRGDGLGENLNLTLLSGGHYVLTWSGCLGWYGAAAGTWRVSEKRLKLQPAEDTELWQECQCDCSIFESSARKLF